MFSIDKNPELWLIAYHFQLSREQMLNRISYIQSLKNILFNRHFGLPIVYKQTNEDFSSMTLCDCSQYLLSEWDELCDDDYLDPDDLEIERDMGIFDQSFHPYLTFTWYTVKDFPDVNWDWYAT